MLKKPESTISDLEEYKQDVVSRLENLEPEEARGIANLHGSPELITISKIIGPEVSEALSEGINKIAFDARTQQERPAEMQPIKKRGLATR